MRTLLVPIDGSASGNRAVAHAVDNAQRLGDVKLLLLNVQPTLERGYPGGLLSAEVRERLQQAAQADAAAALALMDAANLSYEFLVVFGQPAEVITRIAEERGCAGIVMGTRGLSQPGQRLLVCRLSAAVITADGRVTGDERQVYAALLDFWGVTQTMVAHAIMRDHLH